MPQPLTQLLEVRRRGHALRLKKHAAARASLQRREKRRSGVHPPSSLVADAGRLARWLTLVVSALAASRLTRRKRVQRACDVLRRAFLPCVLQRRQRRRALPRRQLLLQEWTTSPEAAPSAADVEGFARNPVLRHLPAEAAEGVLGRMEPAAFLSGEYVAVRHNAARGLFLTTGLGVVCSVPARRKTKGAAATASDAAEAVDLPPGTFFGEDAALVPPGTADGSSADAGPGPRASYRVREDCCVRVLPAEAFREVLASLPPDVLTRMRAAAEVAAWEGGGDADGGGGGGGGAPAAAVLQSAQDRLFDGVSDAALCGVAMCGRSVVACSGDVLCRAGRPADTLYLLLRGQVVLGAEAEGFAGRRGDPAVSVTAAAAAVFFGVESVSLCTRTYLLTLVAASPCELFAFPRAAVAEALAAPRLVGFRPEAAATVAASADARLAALVAAPPVSVLGASCHPFSQLPSRVWAAAASAAAGGAAATRHGGTLASVPGVTFSVASHAHQVVRLGAAPSEELVLVAAGTLGLYAADNQPCGEVRPFGVANAVEVLLGVASQRSASVKTAYAVLCHVPLSSLPLAPCSPHLCTAYAHALAVYEARYPMASVQRFRTHLHLMSTAGTAAAAAAGCGTARTPAFSPSEGHPPPPPPPRPPTPPKKAPPPHRPAAAANASLRLRSAEAAATATATTPAAVAAAAKQTTLAEELAVVRAEEARRHPAAAGDAAGAAQRCREEKAIPVYCSWPDEEEEEEEGCRASQQQWRRRSCYLPPALSGGGGGGGSLREEPLSSTATLVESDGGGCVPEQQLPLEPPVSSHEAFALQCVLPATEDVGYAQDVLLPRLLPPAPPQPTPAPPPPRPHPWPSAAAALQQHSADLPLLARAVRQRMADSARRRKAERCVGRSGSGGGGDRDNGSRASTVEAGLRRGRFLEGQAAPGRTRMLWSILLAEPGSCDLVLPPSEQEEEWWRVAADAKAGGDARALRRCAGGPSSRRSTPGGGGTDASAPRSPWLGAAFTGRRVSRLNLPVEGATAAAGNEAGSKHGWPRRRHSVAAISSQTA